jgi:hypothetical protein
MRLQPGYNYVGQTDARKPDITQREERLRERKEMSYIKICKDLQKELPQREERLRKTFFEFLYMHKKALLS